MPLLPADVTRSKSGEWFTATSRGAKRKVGTPGNSASLSTKQKQPLTINFNHQPPSFRHQTPVLRHQSHLRHQPPDLNQPHLSRQPPHLRHQPRLLHHVRLRHHLSFNPLQNLMHLYQHVFYLTRSQNKQVKGAAKYRSYFQKAWSKGWSFIVALNDPHSFHCVICNRDVTCPHQGRADVERLIKSILHESKMKGAEGLCKLPFTSKQDPFARNSLAVINQNCSN